MPRPPGREPRVDVRRHRGKDGVVREYPAVRYYDADGRCRRLTCATVAEAEYERARMVYEQELEGPVDDGRHMRLATFWPTWHADARGRLAEGTLRDYEYLWRRHVAPRFGEVPMTEITPRAVSQWRAALADQGIGRETARKAMVLLQAMFTVAIEWGEATENPVRAVRKPKQGRERAIEVIQPADVERIRASMTAADDWLSRTLTVVLAYTGMRPAEAIALELRHIRENTILVEQAVSHGKLKLQKTSRVYRTIDLLEPLRDDLQAYVEHRDMRQPGALLFPRPSDGLPWRESDWRNWRARKFHRHTELVGLGRPRPYDLRHSFVSLLVCEQRCSVVDIADQMGHSPTETLKDYAHVMREHRRQKPEDADVRIRRARD